MPLFNQKHLAASVAPNCESRVKRAGYACGHFGKWHLGPVKADSPTSPGAMGFDEWLSHDNFYELDPFFSRNGGPIQQFFGESSEIVVR